MIHVDNHGPVSNQAGVQQAPSTYKVLTCDSRDILRKKQLLTKTSSYQSGSQTPSPVVPPPNYDFGIRLGRAPQFDEDNFIGRVGELEQLQSWLTLRFGQQNVVTLSGLGGMGKTQLSIHMIRQSGRQYSSVFWLDAKDENTLKAGLAALAGVVAETATSSTVTDVHEEERLVQQVRQWLSQRGNDKWLIVYDNCDDLRLPGMDSLTGYDIRSYFPARAQGSILITTRPP